MFAKTLDMIALHTKKTLLLPAGFLLLFTLYHAAEYCILYLNSSTGFIILQLLFFIAAWWLGWLYNGTGLAAWGLPLNRRVLAVAPGLVMGIMLYALPYMVCIAAGMVSITAVPSLAAIISKSWLFAIGVLLSSFSEDVFIRGLPFAYGKGRVSDKVFVVLSSVLYVLNHIYRLGEGPGTWLYIFVLGIALAIPLVVTGNLWFTGSMHWAGNLFFFISYNVVQTNETPSRLTANNVFAITTFLLLPVIYLVAKRWAAYYKQSGA